MGERDRRGGDEQPAEVWHGEILGKWVRQRREELGLYQSELVERMGGVADINWISQLETGRKRRMTPQPYLSALAAALAVNEEELARRAGLIPERSGRKADPAPEWGPGQRKLVEAIRHVSDEEAMDLLPVVLGVLRMARAERSRDRGEGEGG